MIAIREIYQTSSERLTIPVPKAFQNRPIEIIMLPLEVRIQNKDCWPPDFFEKTAGCLSDDPIERAPQGEYEIRETLK
ncbi:MAG: hypothetical protein ABFS56_08055 [Pseudomonadota bacterium]